MNSEERRRERRLRLQALSGVMDFIGLVICAIALVLLVALLLHLAGWVKNDIGASFAVLRQSVMEAIVVK